MSIFSRFASIFRRGHEAHERVVPTTAEEDALSIAAAWAREHRKHWMLPVSASLESIEGRRIWVIQTNATGKGHSLTVSIDDETGQIVGQHELPR